LGYKAINCHQKLEVVYQKFWTTEYHYFMIAQLICIFCIALFEFEASSKSALDKHSCQPCIRYRCAISNSASAG